MSIVTVDFADYSGDYDDVLWFASFCMLELVDAVSNGTGEPDASRTLVTSARCDSAEIDESGALTATVMVAGVNVTRERVYTVADKFSFHLVDVKETGNPQHGELFSTPADVNRIVKTLAATWLR